MIYYHFLAIDFKIVLYHNVSQANVISNYEMSNYLNMIFMRHMQF